MTSLSNQFKKAKKNLDKKIAKAIRKTAISKFNQVIIQTPVDTGRLRGNWQVSINQPKHNILFEGVPQGKKIGRTENIESKLSKSIDLKDVLYLTNNLPYAERIENGWSKQRPAKWVNRIMMGFESEFQKRLKKELKK